jgi:hypothetical protein
LSTGKSAEAAKGRATQQSPKQLAQSGTRLRRVLGRSAMATILRAGPAGGGHAWVLSDLETLLETGASFAG